MWTSGISSPSVKQRYRILIFSFLILRVYARLLIRISLSLSLSLSLSIARWMSVPVFGYIITHCMSIYVFGSYLFFSFSLNICSGYRLYCHLLYVYISLDSCFSFNAYIVTDCNSIDTALDPCFSHFLLWEWGGGGGGECFYPCTAISLSLIVRVKVRLLIRVSLPVFVLSVRLCPGILSVISCMWRRAFSSPSVK